MLQFLLRHVPRISPFSFEYRHLYAAWLPHAVAPIEMPVVKIDMASPSPELVARQYWIWGISEAGLHFGLAVILSVRAQYTAQT